MNTAEISISFSRYSDANLETKAQHIVASLTGNAAYPTPTPKTTCTPRPSCLDSFPRCLIVETSDMCPPTPGPTRVNVCGLEPCLSVTPKQKNGK